MFEGAGDSILEASEEQIRALSHHEEGGIWPFSESKGTINLFEQKPLKSNDYGELREVSPKEHRQLQDINIALAFINVTKVIRVDLPIKLIIHYHAYIFTSLVS